ncbi:MAG: hypothetical protein A4E68_00663 [Syntrophaceae bacterium PtaB.Bin095]|nr:MAG: hypothetical protein A4E68_00663 [Syntrophaceae bacterium PtaB.Bin095]
MTDDRLKAALDEAQRIGADRAEEREARKKPKTITINFNEAELQRLQGRADAAGVRLQDYIRQILKNHG